MRKAVIAILMVAGITNAMAGGQDLAARLQEQYPSTKISAVRESVVKGLYEVVMGRNVAYTDESGRYLVFGHLYDMREQKDLTAGVLDDLNKVDVSALPLADAIKIVRGKGERKLFVFSDPDCPYCKRLEAETAKLDNVTVYTFMMPLESLHPNAKAHARAIWCAPDRGRAWREFMASGKLPSGAATCETPIERVLALGERLGINGTPTIIFGNGQIAAGALPAVDIERRLAGGATTAGAVQRAKTATGG
jgi:thiol:disulfide interchange protein DsbC